MAHVCQRLIFTISVQALDIPDFIRFVSCENRFPYTELVRPLVTTKTRLPKYGLVLSKWILCLVLFFLYFFSMMSQPILTDEYFYDRIFILSWVPWLTQFFSYI